MVKKTIYAGTFLCLLGITLGGCSQQQEISQTPKPKAEFSAACETLITHADREALRAAYTPLLAKQELLALVDEKYGLPQDYIPQDLVGQGKIRLRAETYQWMKTMQEAAKKDGINLFPISAYRSYAYQQGLKERTKNPAYVASPGHSQHQLGTAIDFNTVNTKDENIPALQWLKKHAGEYGFSLSFPKGKEAETGYPYEAWHYRYISKEGVALQDAFFGGNQHKMLLFLNACLWTPEETLGRIETELAAATDLVQNKQ